MQAADGVDDTHVITEFTQVIDGFSLDTLKEMSPSKTFMPTSHDTQ